MRVALLTAVTLLIGGAPALAADDPLTALYGNTLVVTGDGFAAHVHYNADHTLDMSGTAAGQAFSTKGSWKIDDKGQVCRTYDKTPPTMTNPFCSTVAAHKVGDTWTVTTPGGDKRTLTLVAGVQ